ncbi:MAG: hypothetical protein GKR90_26630 [Pseudomonadales bacterium]|nr:hypothetical protein [Pseudomonadales bacterium]
MLISIAALADINDDGKLDLLVANAAPILSDELPSPDETWTQTNWLYLNDGSATPFVNTLPIPIGDEFDDSTDLTVADINWDGLLDVLVANSTDKAELEGALNRIYLNTGEAVPFVDEIALGQETLHSYGIEVADFDGDGYLDVTVANTGRRNAAEGAPNHVYLHPKTEDWSAVVPIVMTTGEGFDDESIAVATGDIDHDGDIDVVYGNAGHFIKLHRNNGTATPFAEVDGEALSLDFEFVHDVEMADFDRDGHLDVATSAAAFQHFNNRLYFNRPNAADDPEPSVFTRLTTSAHNSDAIAEVTVTNSDFAHDVELADVNNDGFLDILSGNRGLAGKNLINLFHRETHWDVIPFPPSQFGRFYWGETWDTEYNIGIERKSTFDLTAGDLDGDGFVDFVSANIEGLMDRVHLNPLGSGGDLSELEFTHSFILGESGTDTRGALVSDVNGNGANDIFTCHNNQPLRLYLNPDRGVGVDPVTGVLPFEFPDSTRGAFMCSMITVDLNADGHLDVLEDVSGGYYINNGTAEPFVGVDRRTYRAPGGGGSFAVADFNQDGRWDVAESFFRSRVSYYLGIGGDEPFRLVTERLATDEDDHNQTMKAVDYDNDGDIDLIKAAFDDGVVFLRNEGMQVLADWYDVMPSSYESGVISLDNPADKLQVEYQADQPAGTEVEIHVSIDGVWRHARSGETISFDQAGTQLAWRAELYSRSPQLTPLLSELEIIDLSD